MASMCIPSNWLVVVSSIGIAGLLHGCGGGGGGGGGTTVTTTTTTATTVVVPQRSKPLTSQQAADYLNNLYLGFSNDSKAPIGVTLSMAAKDTSFFLNQYCAPFFNPSLNGYTGCFNGQADCRMSACVINSAWMVTKATGAVVPFGQRSVGYVFNQTLVETKWTKCSFIWDGASGNRYNRGCGSGAPSSSCEDGSGSAWYDVCPSTGVTCTTYDVEIKRELCSIFPGGETPVPPTHGGNPQCYFPGPAFNFHGQKDYAAGKDFTRDMAKQRVKYNKGKDQEGPNIEKNNEVVLDEELLIPDYWEDPIRAMPAFIYAKSNEVIAKKKAIAMRDEFCKYYYCDRNGGGQIPVVMIDDTTYHSDGPFSAVNEAESAVVV